MMLFERDMPCNVGSIKILISFLPVSPRDDGTPERDDGSDEVEVVSRVEVRRITAIGHVSQCLRH